MVEFTVRLGVRDLRGTRRSPTSGSAFSHRRPTGRSTSQANYGVVPAGYWWEVLFDALAIATLVVVNHADLRFGSGSARGMSTIADTRRDRDDKLPQADALDVENLEITYRVRGRGLRVVRDVSFRVGRGESFGLVGESGCGKSTIALGIVRYLARNGRVSGGKVEIDGRDVLALERERPAQAPPEHGLDGLPGARAGAEPDDQGRAPGGRGVRARRRPEGGGARPRAGDAREGADLEPGRRDEPLSRTSSRAACSSAS